MGRRRPILRAVTWAATLSLLVAAVEAQPAPPRPASQPATTRPAALLPQRWPGAAYDIRRDGRTISRITFLSELAEDKAGGPDRLRFTDALLLNPDGRSTTIRVTTVC